MHDGLTVRHPGRTLVFCNSIKNVRRLTELLRLLNIPAHPIHARKQQSQRLKALDRFRDNENSVMVATDVAARGLDIPVRDLITTVTEDLDAGYPLCNPLQRP